MNYEQWPPIEGNPSACVIEYAMLVITLIIIGIFAYSVFI